MRWQNPSDKWIYKMPSLTDVVISGWPPGEVRYRAPYSANTVLIQQWSIECVSVLCVWKRSCRRSESNEWDRWQEGQSSVWYVAGNENWETKKLETKRERKYGKKRTQCMIKYEVINIPLKRMNGLIFPGFSSQRLVPSQGRSPLWRFLASGLSSYNCSSFTVEIQCHGI